MHSENYNSTVTVVTDATLFLQQLKRQTVSAHKALEDHPLLKALMSPHVTEVGYRLYLQLMFSVVESFEKELLPQLQHTEGKVTASTGSLFLQKDLQVVMENSSPLNYLSTFHPNQCTLVDALGYAYVLEGSKLGGRVIFKHLQQLLGITVEDGGTYLTFGGSDTAANWRTFIHSFSNYVVNNNLQEEVIQAACDAFSSILNYFEQNCSYAN